jgi:hypothetical protein
MSLALELSTDPLARGYAAMNTDQTLASLATANRAVVVETYVTDRTLFSKLGPAVAVSILGKLAGSTDAAVMRASAWVTSAVGFNIGDPVAQGMIDSLTAAGLFTAAEGASLKGLATVTKSRADELGISVDWGVINSARHSLGWAV